MGDASPPRVGSGEEGEGAAGSRERPVPIACRSRPRPDDPHLLLAGVTVVPGWEGSLPHRTGAELAESPLCSACSCPQKVIGRGRLLPLLPILRPKRSAGGRGVEGTVFGDKHQSATLSPIPMYPGQRPGHSRPKFHTDHRTD